MNEFTKEEFERIGTAVSYYAIDVESDNGMKYLALSKKIQSLIDNYCEHEWYEHKQAGIVCKKCGEEYK